MKKVEAIIRPDKLGSVKAAIAAVGYGGLTITQVQGHGKQKGVKEMYRGVEYTVDVLQKVKIEIVVPDADVEKIIDAVVGAGRTGSVGDGKIFISDIRDAVRVRTGERGDKAL